MMTSSETDGDDNAASDADDPPPPAVDDDVPAFLYNAQTLGELQQALDNILFRSDDPSIAALAQQAAQTVRELQRASSPTSVDRWHCHSCVVE
jgi:hypothetical protein